MLVTPKANSCRFVLPTNTQPAARRRLTTGASSAAGTFGRMIPPAVVTIPLTSTRSLTATRSPAPGSSARKMKAFSSTPPIVEGLNWRPQRYPCPLMSAQTAASISANLSWSKVDVLTPFERLTAEIQVRGGRLRETITAPEPLFHMRNVSAEPLVPGAVPLSGVPEGLFNKNLIGGIRTIEPEPPPADQVAEMIRRYVMFQAANFMVTGAAEFPKATEPSMHTEILMKARFLPVVDATVTIFGVAGKSWTQPNIWVNRDLMLAVYLG